MMLPTSARGEIKGKQAFSKVRGSSCVWLWASRLYVLDKITDQFPSSLQILLYCEHLSTDTFVSDILSFVILSQVIPQNVPFDHKMGVKFTAVQ